MPLFPCFAPKSKVDAIGKLYDQHRTQRATRTISKHPALGAPYGRGGAYEGDPYAKLVVTNPTQSHRDNGFDATGFMFGFATGVPISPSYGISTGAMIGAAMHQSPAAASPARSDPDPTPTPSCDPPSSSSYDSGSSSSSSCDSGSSSSSDSGGGGGGGGD